MGFPFLSQFHSLRPLGTSANSINLVTLPSTNRIFFENFESALQAGSTLINGAVIATTETAFSGTKCARVNLKSGATDPFVTVPSNSSTYEYQGDLLLSETMPDVFTLRWKFRFDDALWNGTGWSNSQDITVNLKGGYIGEQDFMVVRGFFIGLEGGPTGQLHFADNGAASRGDSGWQNLPWAVPERVQFFVNTGTPWGADGEWHEWKMIIDNTNADYRVVKMYVDNILATNDDYALDGEIRVPKTWLPETFSTCYTNADRVDLASDRTGTACGIQFDEIEIWDGLAAGDLDISGSWTHGEVATFSTTGAFDFGTRINPKPLYVYAGQESKSGSIHGRDTGDYFNAAAAYQTEYKTGGFAGGIKYDFKDTFQGSFTGLVLPDPTAPALIYKHIYRNFDQNDPLYQNEVGGFNLKTHRIYSVGTSINNFFVGRDGFGFVEYITPEHPARYYAYSMPTFEWASELVYFANSSAPGLMDGRFYHEVNNVWLNNTESDYVITTYDSTQSDLLGIINLDQISNGSGSGVTEVAQFIDYVLIDDEIPSLWIGNAARVSECTNLYPVPAVTWDNNSVSFIPFFIDVLPENAYVYMLKTWDRQTNEKTWLSMNGVKHA